MNLEHGFIKHGQSSTVTRAREFQARSLEPERAKPAQFNANHFRGFSMNKPIREILIFLTMLTAFLAACSSTIHKLRLRF
jgi:hypothetical protein